MYNLKNLLYYLLNYESVIAFNMNWHKLRKHIFEVLLVQNGIGSLLEIGVILLI